MQLHKFLKDLRMHLNHLPVDKNSKVKLIHHYANIVGLADPKDGPTAKQDKYKNPYGKDLNPRSKVARHSAGANDVHFFFDQAGTSIPVQEIKNEPHQFRPKIPTPGGYIGVRAFARQGRCSLRLLFMVFPC